MTRSKILTKWSLKSALIVLGFGLIVTVITITQRTAASGLIPEEIPSLLVRTALIEHLPYYTLKRTFIGQVEPSRSTDLGFELAGKITDILFDEGDQVKQGQVLAHLDIERLLARKQELNSALHQAEANQKLAGITYRRYKDVVKFNGVSEQQLDEAREHLRASRAAVSLAESKLSSIEIEIDKSQLIAPFDASITKRMVDEGQILALGHSVLRLLENSTLEIRVAIAGTLVDTIRKGQKYPLIIHHKTIHGTVKAVIQVRDGSTRTVDVILQISGETMAVRSGDLVKLELAMQVAKTGAWIPVAALSEDARGTWSVYLLQPAAAPDSASTYEVQRHAIEIIHTESDRVFVQGITQDAAQLVVDGLHRIVPGQLVRVAAAVASIDREMI
jgi:membrane fusion protein, multidrug efflux system